MTLSKRDAHLQEFFSADVLKQLDEAEKNVLYEEFANSELRVLSSQPLETIKARLNKYLGEEFKRRLTQIQPEEYEVLKPWYLENCHTVEEIICSKCGVLLGIEVDTKDDNMNPYHHEGKFVVPIGDKLMAYRPRLDGVMGYECGNVFLNPDKKVQKEWKDFDKKLLTIQEANQKSIEKYKKEKAEWDALPDEERALTPEPSSSETISLATPEEPQYIECDNDTRWAQIELDNIPETHVMTSVTKDDRIKVKQEMDATNYAPDVKNTKSGKTVETFELRKVQ